MPRKKITQITPKISDDATTKELVHKTRSLGITRNLYGKLFEKFLRGMKISDFIQKEYQKQLLVEDAQKFARAKAKYVMKKAREKAKKGGPLGLAAALVTYQKAKKND